MLIQHTVRCERPINQARAEEGGAHIHVQPGESVETKARRWESPRWGFQREVGLGGGVLSDVQENR